MRDEPDGRGYETRRVAGAGGVELAVDVWSSPPASQGGKADPQRPGFVLVHGLASNARLYDGVAEILAAAGHPVAAVDLRGHGRSDKPDDGYDYDTMCADVAAVLDDIAIAPDRGRGFSRPVVVGQSFGGNLVVELAHRYPAKVSAIACIDGGMFDLRSRFASFEEVEAVLAPPKIEGALWEDLQRRMSEMHPDWPEGGIRGALANFERRPDGTVAPFLTLARHLRILHAMWESSPRAVYREITVPVLFLPAESPGTPADLAAAKRAAVDDALSLLPRAEVRWFAPADHDVHAQHPDQVAEALLEFGHRAEGGTAA